MLLFAINYWSAAKHYNCQAMKFSDFQKKGNYTNITIINTLTNNVMRWSIVFDVNVICQE